MRDRALFYSVVAIFPILFGFTPGGCSREQPCAELGQYGCFQKFPPTERGFITLRHIGIKFDRREEYSLLLVKEPPELLKKIELESGGTLYMRDPWKLILSFNSRSGSARELLIRWRLESREVGDLVLAVAVRKGNKLYRLLVPPFEFTSGQKSGGVLSVAGDPSAVGESGEVRYFRFKVDSLAERITLSLFEFKGIELTKRFRLKAVTFAGRGSL